MVVLLFALVGIALAADPTAEASRTIDPKVVQRGDEIEITVEFTSLLTVPKSFALLENIPEGWGFTRGTDDASWFRPGPPPEWVWIGVGAGATKTVTYTLSVPVDAGAGDYIIEGTVTGVEVANIVGGDTTVTVRVLHDLTTSSTAGGSVTDPGEGVFAYDEETVVDLIATPDEGYRFDEWTGDVTTLADIHAATTTITMNGDYSITAEFVRQYDLATSSTAGGSVTDPGEATFTYDEGTVVDLLAVADVCYEFINWTGDVGTIADADTASTNITMNGDYSITANFALMNCDYLDYYDDWEYYCVGNEVWMHRLFHDFSCVDGECIEVDRYYTDEQFVESCPADYYTSWVYYCVDDSIWRSRDFHDFYCLDGTCHEDIIPESEWYQDCPADYYGNWEYYCVGNEVWMHRLFHDFSCVDGACTENAYYTDDQFVEDCDDLDGWVEDGDPYTACDGDNVCTYQDMVYMDYSCVGGECVPAETDWRTDLIGCESCDDGNPCTIDTCENGICVHTPVYADILEYYRGLYGNPDGVSTLELLAAADDWIADVVPSCFEEPITMPQLLQLADEWISSG